MSNYQRLNTSNTSPSTTADFELQNMERLAQEDTDTQPQDLLMSSFTTESGIRSPRSLPLDSADDDSDNRLMGRSNTHGSNEMIADNIEATLAGPSSSNTAVQDSSSSEHANSNTRGNDDNTTNTHGNSRIQSFLMNNKIGRQINRTMHTAPVLRYLNNNYNPLASGTIGASNDGVFSNLAAKPTVGTDANGNNNSVLPTYEEASSDPAPPYWEASIMAGYDDEIFVDGLPVGNVINFLWNVIVSVSFQFVGFVITYLLHTSHAAKEGSRAGLGITLINLGYSSIPLNYGPGDNVHEDKLLPDQPNSIDISSGNTLHGSIDSYKSTLDSGPIVDDSSSDWSSSPLLAYTSIALGIFIIIKAIVDYVKARRMERNILNPTPVSELPPAEQV